MTDAAPQHEIEHTEYYLNKTKMQANTIRPQQTCVHTLQLCHQKLDAHPYLHYRVSTNPT